MRSFIYCCFLSFSFFFGDFLAIIAVLANLATLAILAILTNLAALAVLANNLFCYLFEMLLPPEESLRSRLAMLDSILPAPLASACPRLALSLEAYILLAPLAS